MNQNIFRAMPAVYGRCPVVLLGTDPNKVARRAQIAARRYGVRFEFYHGSKQIDTFYPTLTAHADPMCVGTFVRNLGIDARAN
jgi:hypothetical protein